ncbi:Chitinase 1 [Diplodia seriata]|uniref:chitinase n=1 Tax=Diplodia seriata TaxID=420778 RepID=A0A1S8BC57_9PEZI|nr:Chitinase 1 [Diplodia seriata]
MTPACAPSDHSVPAPTTSEQPPFIHGAYYPSWKIYRNQPPSSMDLDIISHVFYAFIRVREDGTIYHLDEKADLHYPIPSTSSSVPSSFPTTTGCLASLTHLRATTHPHLKLLLSLGGASGSSPFPALAASPLARSTLATSLSTFLHTHAPGFDGIDLDWEHPSTPADGRHYLLLLRALRAALPAPRYLLTAALPAGEWCLRHVPLKDVVGELDWVGLMCYDFAGGWTPRSGHHARLYAAARPHDAYGARSVAGAVEYVVGTRGVPAGKVVVGVPVYGRAFLGVDGPGERFEGVGGADGCVDYRELPGKLKKIKEDLGVWGAACLRTGEGGRREWVSFDCPRTVGEKARFVRERGLGGLFYWTGVADKEGEGSLLRAGYEGLYGAK